MGWRGHLSEDTDSTAVGMLMTCFARIHRRSDGQLNQDCYNRFQRDCGPSIWLLRKKRKEVDRERRGLTVLVIPRSSLSRGWALHLRTEFPDVMTAVG